MNLNSQHVIWEFDDCQALISGYTFGKASISNIHCKPCTKVNECHPCQHHKVALVFIEWAVELTCPSTLPFAHYRRDVDLGWIVLLQMLHFEMGLEVIIAPKCTCVGINGVNFFAINLSINSNSINDSTDLTS